MHRTIARFVSGPVIALLGINHFINPDAYERIIPPGVPAERALVFVSGAVEALAALGTMHPRTRRLAGKVLIGTLVAIYPANVYMALYPERFEWVPGGEATLYARLPLQFVLIYWAWLATHADPEPDPAGTVTER